MQAVVLTVWIIQGLLMFVDEFYFHQKRRLGRWERVGHPVDTFCFLLCFLIALFSEAVDESIIIFVIASIISCLVITKDEFVHHEESPAFEQWLHSLLFILHPIALAALYFAWSNDYQLIIALQTTVIFVFMLYQIVYWNFIASESRDIQAVNNDFYDELNAGWYEDNQHPIALLRLEQKVKNPWVDEIIQKYFSEDIEILDVGCGAGFLTNYLGSKYKKVHGLDASQASLKEARKRDTTKNVNYIHGDAYKLPFPDNSMEVVCVMDFLEHVEQPELVIKECARVLKKDGLFFFHTFNRNLMAWLIVIKFVEWFMPNTPKNLHILRLFIKPQELEKYSRAAGIDVIKMHGLGPAINSAFFKSIIKRELTDEFKFELKSSTKLGFVGFGQKKSKL